MSQIATPQGGGSVSGGNGDVASQTVHFTTLTPMSKHKRLFDATTILGLRPTQEDRILICPTVGATKVSFVGVFDGTAGHEAAEFIQRNILSHLTSHEVFNDSSAVSWAMAEQPLSKEDLERVAERLSRCLRDTFLSVDRSLIDLCKTRKLDYVSSTGVTALMWGNVLTIAHVGDSRACIARVVGDTVYPEWLTVDHKPNTPSELGRIVNCGGSLVWLHGSKPYIRGGDFTSRQAMGERPKQLNYSRAFGGKDLKNYGLIAEPDVAHFEIAESDKFVVLASDGLWDVVEPLLACEIVLEARAQNKSSADELVRYALDVMPSRGVQDNISAIVVFFHESG